jgi:hypothetical protein
MGKIKNKISFYVFLFTALFWGGIALYYKIIYNIMLTGVIVVFIFLLTFSFYYLKKKKKEY